jgi:hypothetical protein
VRTGAARGESKDYQQSNTQSEREQESESTERGCIRVRCAQVIPLSAGRHLYIFCAAGKHTDFASAGLSRLRLFHSGRMLNLNKCVPLQVLMGARAEIWGELYAHADESDN